MIYNIKRDTELKMEKCIKTFKSQISKVLTNRVSPSLFDNVMVEYYRTLVPLRQIANITVENINTIKINVFDASISSSVEKAIILSNLDLNLHFDKNTIYVVLPSLTMERRRSLTKFVRSIAEQTRISIRNIRRDANDQVKALLKEKKISEDDDRRSQNEIQKLTDTTIKAIDKILLDKETELKTF